VLVNIELELCTEKQLITVLKQDGDNVRRDEDGKSSNWEGEDCRIGTACDAEGFMGEDEVERTSATQSRAAAYLFWPPCLDAPNCRILICTMSLSLTALHHVHPPSLFYCP